MRAGRVIGAVLLAVVSGVACTGGGDDGDDVAATDSTLPAGTTPGWHEVTEVPDRRRGAAVVAADQRLMFWGGETFGPDDTVPNRAHPTSTMPPPGGYHGTQRVDGSIYDIATNEWSEIPDAPLPFILARIAAWTGRELVVFGYEFTGDGGHPATELMGAAHDPRARSWRALAPGRLVYGHGRWTGHELVVVGRPGGRHDVPLAVDAFDPATNTWRQLGEPPVVDVHSAMGLGTTDDGTLVVNDFGPDQVGLLDAGATAWRKASRSPYPDRIGGGVAWARGRLVRVNGAVIEGGDMAISRPGTAVYDPAADSWTTTAEDLPTSCAVRAAVDDEGAVIGCDGPPERQLVLLDPVTTTRQSLPPPPDVPGEMHVVDGDLWLHAWDEGPDGGPRRPARLFRLQR